MRVIYFSLFFIFVQTANAVPETQVLSFVKEKMNDQEFFETNSFTSPISFNKNLTKIYFTKFGKKKGNNGSIVIAPGRTESSIKYIELAHDLITMQYSPIYVIDHRGQGFSDRILKDKRIGHVANWDHYIKDFDYFVNHIVLKDPSVDKTKLHLVSNSMGGAIALRYFQNYPDHPFLKAALSGSMFGIKYKNENDFTVFLKTRLICAGIVKSYAGKKLDCHSLAPGERYFSWKNRKFEKTLLTHSESRFKMRDLLWKKWGELEVGGPTVEWVKEANKVIYQVTRKNDLDKIKTPILLLTAVEDFRARESGHAKVCRRLGINTCVRLRYKDAFHEIFMEKDRWRNHAIQSIHQFFQTQKLDSFRNQPEIQKVMARDF